ncbi:rhomboid family intramembrane serine protease [Alcaligenes nematophilus]|uniref:rhomboid family intramembrane serine protease n=1 Tax=Alcaligenes nematophilus TaxID=2994643 RepID=UPI00384BBDEB
MNSYHPRLISVSTALTILTIVVSFAVSYHANQHFFSTVKIPVLRSYGGTTLEDLKNLEVWRIATAQLIHAKQAHMLLNAVCLFLLASLVESRIGGWRTFLIWLIAGGIATTISPISTEAPWNVGTGASQATFAFSGCAMILTVFGFLQRRLSWTLIALVVIPGLILDLFHGGYPKLGHAAGFVLGMILGIVYISRNNIAARLSSPPRDARQT